MKKKSSASDQVCSVCCFWSPKRSRLHLVPIKSHVHFIRSVWSVVVGIHKKSFTSELQLFAVKGAKKELHFEFRTHEAPTSVTNYNFAIYSCISVFL